jgi:hypothetical protein
VKLIEVLRKRDLGENEQATIYVARPWSPEAEAIVVSPAPTATGPVERDGRTFDYFLEAYIAQEFLEDLAASGELDDPSEKELCERLVRYAETDA